MFAEKFDYWKVLVAGIFWLRECFGYGNILATGTFWLWEYFGEGEHFWRNIFVEEYFGGNVLVMEINVGKIVPGRFWWE